MTRKKVVSQQGYLPVFVVGTLFSSSTLLGHELTAHLDGVHYVGELANFLRHPTLRAQKAATKLCTVCSIRNRKCPFLTQALRERLSYTDIPAALAAMSEVFSARVVIDGSKYPAWLQLALANGFTGRPPRVIICSRNPFAFALSYQNRNSGALWEGANIWRDIYIDTLRTVHTHRLAHISIRYEDMIHDRHAVMADMAAFMSAPLLPKADYSRCHETGGNWSASVPFVGVKQVGLAVKQEAGRAERFVAQSREYWAKTPKEDTRWQHLSPAQLTQITQTPGLADVASLLGYDLPALILQAKLAAK